MSKCNNCKIECNNIGMRFATKLFCMNCSHIEIKKLATIQQLKYAKYKIKNNLSYEAIKVAIAKLNNDRIHDIFHVNYYQKAIYVINDGNYQCMTHFNNKNDLIRSINTLTGALYHPLYKFN